MPGASLSMVTPLSGLVTLATPIRASFLLLIQTAPKVRGVKVTDSRKSCTRRKQSASPISKYKIGGGGVFYFSRYICGGNVDYSHARSKLIDKHRFEPSQSILPSQAVYEVTGFMNWARLRFFSLALHSLHGKVCKKRFFRQ